MNICTTLLPTLASTPDTINTGTVSGSITFQAFMQNIDSFSFSGNIIGQVTTSFTGADTTALVAQVLSTVRSNPANAGLDEHQIAEQAFTAVVDFRQTGFTGLNNQFAFLQNYQSTTLSNADHFLQTYASGTGNSALDNPLTAAILGGVIDPVYNAGKFIAQNVFNTEFLPAGNSPQSPANFQFWALAGAWAAAQVQVGGSAPGQVVSPAASGNGTSVYVNQVSTTPLIMDPVAASGYQYLVLSGPLFQSIMVPASPFQAIKNSLLQSVELAIHFWRTRFSRSERQ